LTERPLDGGWATFADEYIRLVDEGDPARTRLLDDVMLAECGEVEGKLILDVGAGEGRFSRMLKARGARPLAVDLTWQMVRAARDRSEWAPTGRTGVGGGVADRIGQRRYGRQLHRVGRRRGLPRGHR
jgi:SAM-dependent methyltransferase